jgi:hypothetical protein
MRPTSLTWGWRIVSTAWRRRHHVRRLRLVIVIASVVGINWRWLIVIHSCIRLRLVPLAASMALTTLMMMPTSTTTIVTAALITS